MGIRIFITLFIIVAIVSILAFTSIGSMLKKTNKPNAMDVPHPVSSKTLKVIGWIPFWDQQNAYATFATHPDKFDYLSLFWYHLDENGKIQTFASTDEDTEIIRFAKQKGVKVLALIANLPDSDEKADGWDEVRVQKMIGTAGKRKEHIAEILKLIEKHNFDGVDIDYEGLKKAQRNDFSVFIEELSVELQKRGKILGIAVYPVVSEEGQIDNGPLAQDIPRLGKAADQLYLMSYLEHGTFSSPGPLGGIGWMEDVGRFVTDTLNVPKEKVFLGIGLMGVTWRSDDQGKSFQGEREDVPFQETHDLVLNKKLDVHWDPNARSPHLEFSDESGGHIVWFENKDSVAPRVELAKKLGLGGVGFWRLGGEDRQVWTLQF